MLLGRDEERTAIARLVKEADAGRSRALVVRGEMGVGKSALLEQAVREATGLRVLRAVGVEAEAALPFATLQMLLRPALRRLDGLPGPQAAALRGALGLSDAGGGDRFLVGLAVLTLLSDLAEERPILRLIDDAHWLDPASAEALLFTARRLDADGIALVFAARDDGSGVPSSRPACPSWCWTVLTRPPPPISSRSTRPTSPRAYETGSSRSRPGTRWR